jgi:sulfite exporter TauE/SafE
MGEGTLRARKVATIVMGALIVLGIGVLVVAMVRRGSAPLPAVAANLSAVLDEPAGTRIAGVSPLPDRIAVQLSGGGPDRVVLVDPRSGAVVGRISLAQ